MSQNSLSDKPLGTLVSDLARDLSTLIHKEVQLAKTEITEKVTAAVRGSALLVGAGLFGFVAFEVLVAAVVLWLAQTLSPPLAALIVGGVLLVLAGICAAIGIGVLKKGADPVPRQTVETLKEDARWAKEQMS